MERINKFTPARNGQHFTDDIFKRIFMNENVWISIKISMKFVPKGPINNIRALAQKMVWRHSGNRSLSEPMMVSLPTHICVTRFQWVNWMLRIEWNIYSLDLVVFCTPIYEIKPSSIHRTWFDRVCVCQNFEEICKYVRLTVCLCVCLSVCVSFDNSRTLWHIITKLDPHMYPWPIQKCIVFRGQMSNN